MKVFWTRLEQLCHGALWGGFIGIFAGFIEYMLLYSRSVFPDNFIQAYWDIIPLYALAGVVGGLFVAVGLRFFLGNANSFGQHITRLWAVLVALVGLSYLVVYAIYHLGPGIFKLSNILAYLAALTVATVISVLFHRALQALLLCREQRSHHSEHHLRLRIPVVLGILSAVVLFVSPLYLERVHSALAVAKGSPLGNMHGQGPNIVFILIDALRADHLPIYGYSRQTAPNLTALAQRGMTFTRMYAQASWTKPSVATILSALYPAVHKVNDDGDFLPHSVTVLPEILRTAGYNTFGVSANAYVSPTFGYSRGFDEFRVWRTSSALRLTMMGRVAEDVFGSWKLSRLLREQEEIVPRAEAITDITLKWVAHNDRKPFFLYVHYIDPHEPYSPPPPYDKAFDYRSDSPIRAGGVDPLALLANGQDRERVGRILDQYDGEILYADYHVGRLLKELENLGVLENALVMVTADHGEEFFEHGNDKHGKSAYEEVLRIPLLVHWRQKVPAGTTYDGVVGHIDVLPTILTLIGMEPPAGVQGNSFAEVVMKPIKEPANRQIFAQVVDNSVEIEMVRNGGYKLIRYLGGAQEGREELYDLEHDPLERTDIAPRAAARVAALTRELEAFNKFASQSAGRIRAEQVQKLDRDTERALRSLGYIK